MRKTNLLIPLSVVAFAGFALASCSDYDKMDTPVNENIALQRENDYNKTFKNIYGEIAPGTTWDYSEWGTVNSTRAVGDVTNFGRALVTEVEGIDWGTLTYRRVEGGSAVCSVGKNAALFNEISQSLPEGRKQQGQMMVLTAPGHPFTIYPLTCTIAATYDFYIKVGNEPEKLMFSKDWDGCDHPYVNGKNKEDGTGNVKECAMNGFTIDAPVGTIIQLYIKNIKDSGNLRYANNTAIGTASGSICVASCDLEKSQFEGIPEDILKDASVVKFIGFEEYFDTENYAASGDCDFNDLVLLMVGRNKAPLRNDVEEDVLYVPMSKRYMVEDLGSTSASDIDFNDIVVDVTAYKKYNVTWGDNGEITNYKEVQNDKPDDVIVRAMGGTLDFDLYIDNKLVFSKGQTKDADGTTCTWNEKYLPISVKTPYNVGKDNSHVVGDESLIDFNATICTITGFGCNIYKPEANNTWFKVYTSANGTTTMPESVKNDKNSWVVLFPKTDQVPKMIAFDPDPTDGKKWRPERVGITKQDSYSWFAY